MNKQVYIIITTIGTLLTASLWAQKDTTKNRTVDITSAFKPVLRESAKINFDATPPLPDNTKPNLLYTIPNQNLVLGFQPGSLRPLALNIDSGGKWDNSNYIKLGYGNLRTPFVQAGISLGDGQYEGLSIYAKHVASKGKIDYQDFTKSAIGVKGFYKTSGNNVWTGGIDFKHNGTYKYGFQQGLSFTKDSLQQRFQEISFRVGLSNTIKTEFGILYAPELKAAIFSDNHDNKETNTIIDLPLKKAINEKFSAHVNLNFDFTRTSPAQMTAINNSTFFLAPSVQYKDGNVNVSAGIRPSWDNKEFKMFPDIMVDLSTSDQRFAFQAGWTGHIRKTSYKYLASQNPWLWIPDTFNNTWVEERYAGFKGVVGDHIAYGAKIGFNRLNNQPLFVNDTTTGLGGKSFLVVYEPKMNVVNLSAQIGYTIQEKFSVLGTLNLNQYAGLKVHEKAWGLIPLDLTINLRSQIANDLWAKADLFAYSGSQYRKEDGTSNDRLGGAMDLNAGLEFKALKNLSLWLQFNNIANNKYQRWNQYQTYGFNFVAGVVFSFDKKN